MILKALFDQYRSFFYFLGKFFFSYLVLTWVYRGFILPQNGTLDFFTENVSLATEKLGRFLGMDYSVRVDVFHYKVYYKGKFIARIMEGCNAISVIILFIAFILAFSGTLKATILYILLGSFLVYLLNIFRILGFVVLYQAYPEYEHFHHGVLFPAIIYGIVFLLWLFWIKKYSDYVSKAD